MSKEYQQPPPLPEDPLPLFDAAKTEPITGLVGSILAVLLAHGGWMAVMEIQAAIDKRFGVTVSYAQIGVELTNFLQEATSCAVLEQRYREGTQIYEYHVRGHLGVGGVAGQSDVWPPV